MKLPKHTNPSPQREDRRARAPYNFVPLPDEIIPAEEPPTMDRYHDGLYSGWLECELTNDSPLYIRAGLTEEEARQIAEIEQDAEKQRKELRILPRPDFFFLDPRTCEPVIPGSSLRGMFRTLIEIITYSKVQPVTDKHKMFFRAIAAPKEDPLSDPYKRVIGPYGRNVKAGYVERHGEHWYVKPAQRPHDLGLPGQGAYLKVKDRDIRDGDIPGFMHFTDEHYRPQYHEVSFDVQRRHGKRGEYVTISRIGPRDKRYRYRGVLVCSGNMGETSSSSFSRQRKQKGRKGQFTRTHHALVLDPLPNAQPLLIREQTVKDYIDGLTESQKQSPPFDKQRGCLIEGRPIFYVEEKGEVIAFGHTPYFRIPAWLHGSSPKRAATPLDLVPPSLRDSAQTDIAETLFGYVEQGKTGKRPVARAGRLSFSDARCTKPCELTHPLVPHILATPKPTTFQHYLVQDKARGHNPDVRKKLAHYGTPTPDETVIRGHKLYWHKGKIKIDDITENQDKFGKPEELMEQVKKGEDTQHTIIRPLEPGARFYFRIDFENLRAEELGALLWLLEIAADDRYRLKLGMGKPLGMGAVKITSKLHLIDRQARYQHLFEGDAWATGEQDDADTAWEQSVQAFEQNILQQGKPADRIQELLALLAWPGPDRELTRYLEIEHLVNGNEYKKRPVLPTPTDVQQASTKQTQTSPPQPDHVTSPYHTGTFSETSVPPEQPPPPPPAPPAPCTAENLKHPQGEDEIQPGDCLEGELIGLKSNQAVVLLSDGSRGTLTEEDINRAFKSHSALEDVTLAATRADPSLCRTIEEKRYRILVQVVKRKKKSSKSPWKLKFIRWAESQSKGKAR